MAELKKQLETIRATLKDTESILFNPFVSKALRHCQRADPQNARFYIDLLNKLQLLAHARRRRAGRTNESKEK